VGGLAFGFGVAYEDFWGHRGFTHSLLFALLASLLVVATRFREKPRWTGRSWRLVAFFFVITASHGVLDALTDGGLGIAFFSPFDDSRYFLPWTPLQVSPIGRGFFSEEGLEVLVSEAQWIGLPCVVLLVLARMLDIRRKIAATLKPPTPH
jgi:inner membrane protein